MSVDIACPKSVFDLGPNPGAGPIITVIILQLILGIPIMILGLFVAFFGARIKVLMMAFQIFLFIGIPLMMPIVFLMMENVHSIRDLSPIYMTSLAAASVATLNNILAVLKASDTTKAQVVAFSTGTLFSGIFMTIWLPYIIIQRDMDRITKEDFQWIVLGGALMPGIILAAFATDPKAQPIIYAANFGVIGGFIFIGVLSGWLGGGDLSLLALATGKMAACSPAGYASFCILAVVFLGGSYCNFIQIALPEPLERAFYYIFKAEDKLLELGSSTKHERGTTTRGQSLDRESHHSV